MAKAPTPLEEALSTFKTLGIEDPASAFSDVIESSIREAARKANEPIPAEGPLRGLPTGDIELALADVVIRFRPVNVGDIEVLAPMLTDGTTVLNWWRKAAELLGDNQLPEDSKLPGWLANDDSLPGRAWRHWNTLPTQAPGT